MQNIFLSGLWWRYNVCLEKGSDQLIVYRGIDSVINDEKYVFRDQKIPQNSKVDPRYFSPLYHNSLANSKIQMKFSPSSVEIQTIQTMSFIYNLYTS